MIFSVWRCEGCGRRSFPHRELCPYCAGRAFVPEAAGRGIVTELTTHRGVHVACVQICTGVRVLARGQGAFEVGSEVSLRLEDGVPIARGGDR